MHENHLARRLKSIAESWEYVLEVCNTHVSILEEEIYEETG